MHNFRSLSHWVLPALVGSLSLTLLIFGLLLWPRGGNPDTLGPMPSFEMANQNGQTVRSTDLRGKVLIVGLIYTNCTDICPVTTSRMKMLQDDLRRAGLERETVLLSITVDPERDTPQVLAKYADQFQADPANWHFLTGPVDYVRKVVVDGFMLGVQQLPHPHGDAGAAVRYEVTHSDRLVVVDKQGQIRTTFRTVDLDLAKTVALVKTLR